MNLHHSLGTSTDWIVMIVYFIAIIFSVLTLVNITEQQLISFLEEDVSNGGL